MHSLARLDQLFRDWNRRRKRWPEIAAALPEAIDLMVLVMQAGLDFQVRRKERSCVLGANGVGKSTLLKLAAGATGPNQGTVTVGSNVRMGYFAQHSMDLLDGDDTVFESLDESFPQAGQGVLR